MSEIKIKFNGTELTEFGFEREAVSADGKKICPYCVVLDKYSDSESSTASSTSRGVIQTVQWKK